MKKRIYLLDPDEEEQTIYRNPKDVIDDGDDDGDEFELFVYEFVGKVKVKKEITTKVTVTNVK